MTYTRWHQAEYWDFIYPGGYYVQPGQVEQRTRFYEALKPPVLILGAAFGVYVDALRRQGIEAWGIEHSEHVWALAHSDRDAPAPADAKRTFVAPVMSPYVLRADARDCDQVLDALSEAGAPDFATVVTEDMINGYWGDDLALILDSCDVLAAPLVSAGYVVHIISTLGEDRRLGDSSMFWHPLSVWQEHAPHHRWVNTAAL